MHQFKKNQLMDENKRSADNQPMENMDKLTAPEILKKHLDKNNVIITKLFVGYIYGAMEEYANQQSEELQAEIKRLNEYVPMAVYDKLQKKADEYEKVLQAAKDVLFEPNMHTMKDAYNIIIKVLQIHKNK